VPDIGDDTNNALRVNIVTPTLATDATHDAAASTTGPQAMGECDDTTTDAVDEGDAGRLRINCTTRALFAQVSGQGAVTPIFCTSSAFLNMTTATTTQIVALSGSTHVYVCSYAIHVGGAADVKLVSGTGSNCATSQADTSTTYDFAVADAGINRAGAGGGVVSRTNDAGDALCVTSSAAVDVDVEVSYAQF